MDEPNPGPIPNLKLSDWMCKSFKNLITGLENLRWSINFSNSKALNSLAENKTKFSKCNHVVKLIYSDEKGGGAAVFTKPNVTK
ncbi:hypothetical protein YC2023_047454 [Brassica napus]